MGQRLDRLSHELQHQVSSIIHDELEDPRIGFVTITKAEISADLQHAKIHFSVLGDKAAKEKAQKGLKSAAGFIRRLIGERMKMRYNPELHFFIDESAEFLQHMDDVLREDKDKHGSE